LGRMRRGHSTGIPEVPADGLRGQRHARRIARPDGWRRAAATLASAACLAILGAACSDDNGGRQAEASAAGGNNDSTTTEETTTTLSARQQEEQAVTQALEAAFQARIDAAAPPAPNPDFAALAETHTGLMLERWRNTVMGLQLNEFAIRYPENSQRRLEIESFSFEGQDVVILEVCTVDDGERIAVPTGEVLSSGVATIHSREAMRREGGVWKLAEREELSVDEGVVGCAAD